jgi:hypothetical protein
MAIFERSTQIYFGLAIFKIGHGVWEREMGTRNGNGMSRESTRNERK